MGRYKTPQLPRSSSKLIQPNPTSIHSSTNRQVSNSSHSDPTEPNRADRSRSFSTLPFPVRHGGGQARARGAAGAAPGGAGGAHAGGAAPPLLARPLPHPDGAHRVAPRLQARPGSRWRQPGAHRRAGPGAGARGVLPARRPPGRVRRRRAAGGLRPRRRGVVHRGRRAVPAGGRRLPRVPARRLQGRAAPSPAPQAHPRRREQAHPAGPGDDVRLRRLRGGVPVQPRGGGRAGRGAVHGRRRRAGARRRPHLGAPGVGPRRDPQPVARAGRQPPGARGRQAPRVPRHRHLRRLHQPLQGPVRSGDGRRALLGVRGAHRQGVAEPHPRGRLRRRVPGPPLLRHERAPAPRLPPPARLLRQQLLHHARLLHGREGGLLLHHRHRQAHQGGEEAPAVGVRAVGRRGDAGLRPVPDHLRLPDAARLRLDPPGLRRGGLRMGPARARRAADKPGLHRHVHPRQAMGTQARRKAHHAVRHAGPRHRLPRRHGGHQLASCHYPPPFVHGFRVN